MKKIVFLLALIVVPIAVIFFSRVFLPAHYLFHSLYKVIFLAPLFYRYIVERKTIRQSLVQDFSFTVFHSHFLTLLVLGIALFSAYIFGFLAFENSIDKTYIATELGRVISVNSTNLLFIGLYIILFNSLFEEFFWRGFLFKEMYPSVKPWMAHMITGIGFSFHHITFYYGWFDPLMFVFATVGLVIFAVVMNFVFHKYRDLFSCWFVHAIADVAQVLVAFRVFGLV